MTSITYIRELIANIEAEIILVNQKLSNKAKKPLPKYNRYEIDITSLLNT